MRIRDATEQDAAAACKILRRSIVDLCVADHHGDPRILTAWLGNKTPQNVLGWIERPDSSLLVAVNDAGAILAVGSVTDAGEINLNYVSPEARFRGISRAMLKALEDRATARGAACCVLTSTQTARRFYLRAGYAEDAPAIVEFGVLGHPMSKHLAADRL